MLKKLKKQQQQPINKILECEVHLHSRSGSVSLFFSLGRGTKGLQGLILLNNNKSGMEECNHLNINNIIHFYMTSTVSEGYIEESKFENFWKF